MTEQVIATVAESVSACEDQLLAGARATAK